MIILDWEIFEAYRNWKRTYGEAGALEAIKKKWFDQMCNPTKDTHFIVGTDNRFNKFMVLGVFWPELQPYQDLLF